jgi:transcriptional regulator of acetoin/glycerol metabolism
MTATGDAKTYPTRPIALVVPIAARRLARADPRRATHTIADPLTGDESDDALLRMPFKEARAAAIDAFEERYVLHLLERTQHNVSKAARLAGIDRNYLYRMVKKHGIARKE